MECNNKNLTNQLFIVIFGDHFRRFREQKNNIVL